MTILTRYVIWNVMLVFTTTMLIFSLAFGGYMVSIAVIQNYIPFLVAVKLIPCILPQVFRATFPVAFLLACCFFFGKMTSNNEIIALKAMGIPIQRALYPVWIIGIILSVLCVWFNDLSLSWGERASTRVIVNGLEETIFNKLKLDGKFEPEYQDMILNVQGVTESNKLIKPQLTNKRADFRVTAEQASLSIELRADSPRIDITLDGAYVEHDQGRMVFQDSYTYPVPIPSIASLGDLGEPTMFQIKDALDDLEAERAQMYRKLAINGAFALVSGNFKEFQNSRWVDRYNSEKNFNNRRNKLKLKNPRSWASGFTCFFFIWVGIPFSIRFGQKEYLLRSLFCFLLVLITYYPLLIVSVDGIKSGTLNAYFVWTGNLVFGIVGLWLLNLIKRH